METVSRTGTVVAPDDRSRKCFCCWLQSTTHSHMYYIGMTEFFVSLKLFFSIFTFKLMFLLYLLYPVTCILKPNGHKTVKIFTLLFSWVKIWISLRSRDVVPFPHHSCWKDIGLILGSFEVNTVVLPQKAPQYGFQCSWSQGLLQHTISIPGLTPSSILQPVSHQIFVSLISNALMPQDKYPGYAAYTHGFVMYTSSAVYPSAWC